MEYCLVAYDVQSNKARRRLSALLDQCGERLQKSVYMIRHSARVIAQVEAKALENLDEGDSLLILPCCEACMKKARYAEADGNSPSAIFAM